jgi:DNA integrity scanning protein DisA with diadenylate cyclase activity
MDTKEAGRKGGLATSKKYGKEHYQKLAENMNLGGKKVKIAIFQSEWYPIYEIYEDHFDNHVVTEITSAKLKKYKQILKTFDKYQDELAELFDQNR